MAARRKLAVKRFVLIALCLLAANGIASGQSGKVITAARANGTYRHNDSVIRILALGNHKLRIQLDLIYSYKSKYGLEANIGQAFGEAMIDDDVATFHPPGFPDCTITIKFLGGNKIKVTQDRDAAECGFGQHVSANGTYAKVKAGKPKFEVSVLICKANPDQSGFAMVSGAQRAGKLTVCFTETQIRHHRNSR